MRRTQAGQIDRITLRDGAPSLAETCCRRCGAMGVTVVALGRNDNGAIERVWCGTGCAVLDGWPFLRSESDAPPPAGQGSLFDMAD